MGQTHGLFVWFPLELTRAGEKLGIRNVLKGGTITMSGPLEGVKVVEISMFQQGPVAGMRLGDLGADVIKIEAKTGDPARGFMKIIGAWRFF